MGVLEILCVFLIITQTREDMVHVRRANPSENKMLVNLRQKLMAGNADYDYDPLDATNSPPKLPSNSSSVALLQPQASLINKDLPERHAFKKVFPNKPNQNQKGHQQHSNVNSNVHILREGEDINETYEDKIRHESNKEQFMQRTVKIDIMDNLKSIKHPSPTIHHKKNQPPKHKHQSIIPHHQPLRTYTEVKGEKRRTSQHTTTSLPLEKWMKLHQNNKRYFAYGFVPTRRSTVVQVTRTMKSHDSGARRHRQRQRAKRRQNKRRSSRRTFKGFQLSEGAADDFGITSDEDTTWLEEETQKNNPDTKNNNRTVNSGNENISQKHYYLEPDRSQRDYKTQLLQDTQEQHTHTFHDDTLLVKRANMMNLNVEPKTLRNVNQTRKIKIAIMKDISPKERTEKSTEKIKEILGKIPKEPSPEETKKISHKGPKEPRPEETKVILRKGPKESSPEEIKYVLRKSATNPRPEGIKDITPNRPREPNPEKIKDVLLKAPKTPSSTEMRNILQKGPQETSLEEIKHVLPRGPKEPSPEEIKDTVDSVDWDEELENIVRRTQKKAGRLAKKGQSYHNQSAVGRRSRLFNRRTYLHGLL